MLIKKFVPDITDPNLSETDSDVEDAGESADESADIKTNPGVCLLIILRCVVPEYIHNHPMEGLWKFRRAGGLSLLKGKVRGLIGNSMDIF